jgi:thiol:disulfide interchange protein DsbD
MLDKLPRSGGWLNSVKVVLGFVELALGLKFLSVADQTYHWHLLDREVYLAIWIVIFTLLGLYLLGKLRFKYDSPLEYISLGRLALAIADFAFVVYLIPGMWGAPLKALSGYLPPMETQDFVLGRYAEPSVQPSGLPSGTISLPHSLSGYTSLNEALEEAAEQGKKVFVDISGHGCVNCREMEARVWSDPEVLERLREDFVILALYVDDKTKLPESEWITTPSGKVLKDVGRVNSQLVYERFGVNSQPNYLILDPEGNILAGPYSYNLSISDFLNFLKQ